MPAAGKGLLVAVIAVFLLLSWAVLGTEFLVPDSAGYIAYIRSLAFDHDIYFGNEFDALDVQREWNHLSHTGYTINMFAIGSSILWTPFFALGHAIAYLGSAAGSEASPDGLSQPYLQTVHLGSCFLGLLALLMCWKLAVAYSRPRDATVALFAFWLGSPFVYYFFFDGVFAHVNSAFVVAVFVLYWHKTRGQERPKRWALLGILGGMAVLARWQEAVFFICPLMELAKSVRQTRLKRTALNLATMMGFALLTFAPQMIAWQAIYGSPLAIPQGPSSLHWYAPEIGSLLVSPHHGLLVWSPIYLLVPVGLYFLYRRDRLLGAALSACLALQIYTNSVHHWSGGWSFGVRRIVDCTIIGVVALAALLSRIASPRFRKAVIGFVVVCTAWTVLLAVQMRTEMIDPEAYVSLGTLAANQINVLLNAKHYLSLLLSTTERNGPLPVRVPLIILVAALTAGSYWLWKRVGQRKALEIAGWSSLVLSMAFSALIASSVIGTEVSRLQNAEERRRFEALRRVEASLTAAAGPQQLLRAADLSAPLAWDQKAREYLRRYLTLKPEDDEARFNLGITLLKTQEFAEAHRTFLSLRSSSYRPEESTYYIGVALMGLERFEEAFSMLLDADVEGRLARTRIFNAAECLRRLGRNDEARSLFLQVLRADPDNRPARLRMRMLGD